MTSDEIARWLQLQLANTGAWFTPVSTAIDRSVFDIDMPDGVTSVTITVDSVKVRK